MSTDTNSASSPHFDELRGLKLRDGAAAQLKAQIISGAIQPGVLYSVSSVAAQLGVSATPVREAVLDLAKDGLVEMVRNRGFRVLVLTDKDLDDLVELRLTLEVPAMGRLAEARPTLDLSDLRPAARELEELASRGDMVGFVALDREFHLGLTALLDNPRYTQVVGLLRDQTRLSGLASLEGATELIDSAREHAQLLDLIEAGDSEATRRLMTQHLQHARGLWAGRPESDSDG